MVVISRYAEYRQAESLERIVKALISCPALILNNVSRDDDRVRRPSGVVTSMFKDSKKGFLRSDTVQLAIQCRMQMRVSELQEQRCALVATLSHISTQILNRQVTKHRAS
jgi:hypothetical protein